MSEDCCGAEGEAGQLYPATVIKENNSGSSFSSECPELSTSLGPSHSLGVRHFPWNVTNPAAEAAPSLGTFLERGDATFPVVDATFPVWVAPRAG